ncbi:MAG: hypothetical protein HYI21_03630 [Sediminibacterium sp. Gen4]|uniref:hypothetical protein n=1 Tax=unclassified Sediminibacterium TaxID=2635961 RepID=UPI0015C0DF72|nr:MULTISPECIES: hypothetical protein [unclassified Sediminibacterium]MBW0161927.1 hypothetical protein [Sediminibacterium sp.]MBW0165306.1 hypothetical protein [Sediminibacterium sp.]NWK65096.1 hypothetical protein [Sediminibacterium sp. Gen4]
MKHFYFLMGLFFWGMVSSRVVAQEIDSIMDAHANIFPKEKMHIHFDKQLYNQEETIWYKLYLLAEYMPSPLSKNVYVNWYDTEGKMLRQTVAPLFQATAKGSFDIPTDYKGEFVRVKAYTSWMLNDDTSFIYQRDIPINKGIPVAKIKPVRKTRLELFPEGGNLVYGIDEKIAFKASDQQGRPVMVKAQLMNQKNQVLDTLRVKHDGMGFFFLKPLPEEQYRVDWIDEYGMKGSTQLTGIQKEGLSLSITGTNDKALIQVERTAKVPENMQQLYLLVHMNERPMYKLRLNMTAKTVINTAVPIEELQTGILQFSLFTNDWIPLEERILFVNNRMHEFNSKINPGIVSLEKRGKNILEILVSDTAAANMSISITDAELSGEEQHTIFSDFLISHQLRGYIHNPAYYLKSDADTITARLDLVMLTNGWRRFDWDKLKAATQPVLKYAPETEFIKLKGKVYGMESGRAGGPELLNVIMKGKDSSSSVYFIPIQKDGTFDEPLSIFFDTARVYYNFNDKNKTGFVGQVQLGNGLLRKEPGSTIRIDQMPVFQVWSDSIGLARMNLFLQEQEKLRRSMATATLEEVVVKAKIKDPIKVLDEKYASGLFSGGDAYSFDLANDNMPGALNVLSYLQGKVAGLQISGSGAQMSMSWRGGTPSLYLNEMITNVDMVQSIPITDIAYIKVMRPPFFGSGGGGADGAIAIYTKKGGDVQRNDPNKKGMESTILAGYSKFKEFYNPVYTKEPAYEADTRSTLYWNPYILTNKKTPRFRVEFYNNDFSKKLLVVLEGINSEGRMTRTVRYLE